MTKWVRLRRQPNGQVIHAQVAVADAFWTRFQGWMGRRVIGPQDALLLTETPAIHTMFMRQPIDVVILSKAGRVLAVAPAVAPWRLLKPVPTGRHALELAAGQASDLAIEVGDSLSWEPTSPPDQSA
jgi:hypothetical protein